MRSRALILAALVFPLRSLAQTNPCAGDDGAAAEAARSRSSEHFARADRLRGAAVVPELRLALAAAEEQCAAGDVRGLGRRALAHKLLGELPEAARDLDLFLSLRHLDAEDEETRAFLSSLVAELARTVARVEVRTRLPTLTAVMVDGVVGDPPTRLYARVGRARLSLSSPGLEEVTRVIDLTPGRHTVTVDDRADPMDPAPGELAHITLRAIEPASAASSPSSAATPSTTPRSPASRPLRTWILPAALSAGAFAALGVAFSIWYAADRAPYDRLCFASGHDAADCRARYDDLNTAEALGITSFVLAGALTATAVTLWLLDHRTAASPSVATRGCSLTPAGVRCLF